MTTYVQDDDGKFIPASQRPDGTWRKARRVKDGYVPQEEVPLYESKGKQHAKITLPIGMCSQPRIVDESKRKSKQKPGILVVKTVSPKSKAKPIQTVNQTAKTTVINHKTQKNTLNCKNQHVNGLLKDVQRLDLNQTTENGHGIDDYDDSVKAIKKLRKKIREIEAIEEKLKTGDLKSPEKDQLDKVARKGQFLKELLELERQTIIGK